MGFLFEEQDLQTGGRRLRQLQVLILPRWFKTLFFLVSMLFSLLLLSAAAPLLFIVADALLPSAAFLSAFTFSSLLRIEDYDFRRSLVDIPIVSVLRSFIILCVYGCFCCNRRRPSSGVYLAVAIACSAVSLAFVSLKAAWVVMIGDGGYGGAMGTALFVSSLGFGIGHSVAAYRTSSRERRKLMVYKIDIEAVTSACANNNQRQRPKK